MLSLSQTRIFSGKSMLKFSATITNSHQDGYFFPMSENNEELIAWKVRMIYVASSVLPHILYIIYIHFILSKNVKEMFF